MQSPDIMSVEVLEEYSLKLTFTNGETKIFDIKPLMVVHTLHRHH
ncbi:hypothetical protein CPAST_c30600 [Clostridium pasteurianum DSM 525 = ATCC 6013]|uniref:DUF2442 domain-containing protein n=1 Tax=Clostridium pasteurianum DSM 525 = ATCC 6013 TaxID=1262449 RepID=A0A0H3J5A0_CLOPA|nr:hypothetical protein [Clostridium pasteurianum]AJA49126.1 hypothetical protein CPAST_c30600 [Clostridium pasteurianum DSM 525 = ATCC 6013]AJA53114.1 hypothetical protein CLPA_c30600 [Clostridium pasteurianum DSM 525 = ATCC 6013]ELP59060.1 hypothetical protein F502_11251 [Clostridium pasteurianum DSM 525 = ATCC 6013]KRU10878.1 Protein of unknown function DUF2442 [Clostridium pasteurianum DSM 525 = ATCC 6013]UZW13433.1 hypothetical protein OSC52_16530 [Clostridium pasteurianum]